MLAIVKWVTANACSTDGLSRHGTPVTMRGWLLATTDMHLFLIDHAQEVGRDPPIIDIRSHCIGANEAAQSLRANRGDDASTLHGTDVRGAWGGAAACMAHGGSLPGLVAGWLAGWLAG